MTDIVQGLFGANPQELAAQRQAALQAQGNAYAAQDPFARASSLLYQGGNQLAGAIGGMLGGQDPQMVTAAKIAAIVKNGDQTTPEGMMAIAKQFAAEGLSGPASLAQQKAQEMQLGQAKVSNEQAQTVKHAAEANKIQYGMQQDMALRDALAKLGPDASETDVVKTVAQFGSPDKVLSVVQNAQDKRAARDQALTVAQSAADAKVEAAKTAADAKIEAAREAGATKLQIAQMQAANHAMIAQMQVDSKNQIAQLMVGFKMQGMASKEEEKKAKEAAQKAGVVASFDSAMDTLDRIENHPGKKSAVGFGGTSMSLIPGTDAAGFASQLETFKAQVFLPQVQALKGMGALSDAEGKKMSASIGALSQTMKPAEFDSQLAIIRNDLKKARARVNSESVQFPVPSAPAPVAAPTAAEGTWAIKLKAK
jgi:hypothetical protein